MATIDSPRRILGDLNVNKPHFPSAMSPFGKHPSFSPNSILREKGIGKGELAQVFLFPKMQSTSPASATSKPSSKKRGAACLGDVQGGPPQKQTFVGLPRDDCHGVQSGASDCEPRPLQGERTDGSIDTALRDVASDYGQLRRSMSSDSSFDATQDSETLGSQNTSLTEPEDAVPLPFSAPTTAHSTARRVVSQGEARENAAALCLRLKVAMYKVKTNQIDLPLSQLQIRPSRVDHSYSRQSIRTLLPGSKAVLVPNHNKPVTFTRHPSQDIDITAEECTTIPYSSPPGSVSPEPSATRGLIHSDFATPILPRSRDRYSNPNSRESPDPRLEVTSSVVKGRAADGLLCLMGGGPRL